MNNLHGRTFVTYPGGSGGDLLTATFNGITCTPDDLYHTEHGISYFRVPPFTIKKSDKFIRAGLVTLADVVSAMPYSYLSTHLISEIKSQAVIKLVVSDSKSMDAVIYRQQMLQVHDFRHGETLVELLKNLCDKQKYQQAAELFLHFALKHGHQVNQARSEFQFDQALTLDLSDIMSPGFIPENFPAQFRDLFVINHKFWLQYQKHVSESELIARLQKSIPFHLSRISK